MIYWALISGISCCCMVLSQLLSSPLGLKLIIAFRTQGTDAETRCMSCNISNYTPWVNFGLQHLHLLTRESWVNKNNNNARKWKAGWKADMQKWRHTQHPITSVLLLMAVSKISFKINLSLLENVYRKLEYSFQVRHKHWISKSLQNTNLRD